MQTQVSVRIATETSETNFGYWDNEREVFVPISDGSSEEELAEFAEWLQASSRLIEAITMTIEDFKRNVSADLIDIWQQLDRLEKQ